jgi:hypothetical protein
MPTAFQQQFRTEGSGPNRMCKEASALNSVLFNDAQIVIEMISSLVMTE